jgi:hypothetical protein
MKKSFFFFFAVTLLGRGFAFAQRAELIPAAPALYRSFSEAILSLAAVDGELPAEVDLGVLLLPRNQVNAGFAAYKGGEPYRHSDVSGKDDFSYHCAPILGYSDGEKTFRVIGSYGSGWGE